LLLLLEKRENHNQYRANVTVKYKHFAKKLFHHWMYKSLKAEEYR